MTVSTTVVSRSRERAFSYFSAMFALLASQCMMIFSDAYLIQPISHQSSCYFTGKALLPPLERLDGNNDRRTSSDGMLSVMYTNDPSQVSTWLSDHVPSEGCTLGFDLEVRNTCCWYTVHACARSCFLFIRKSREERLVNQTPRCASRHQPVRTSVSRNFYHTKTTAR